MKSLRAVGFLIASFLPPASSAWAQGFSPEEAVKRMKVADGLQVKLIASEPIIRQPVTMSFDDESLVLAGELERVETSIASIVDEMDRHGESPVLFQRLRGKEARKRELLEQLKEARQKAQYPLSETWGETQTFIDALDNALDPQDARMRLRSAIRRIVTGSPWPGRLSVCGTIRARKVR
jgi:hypothetical protein